MKTKFSQYKKQIVFNKFYSMIFGKKKMVMKYYKKAHGYEYEFDSPKLFTEKINTRKLEKNPLYTMCADKIKVRNHGKFKCVVQIDFDRFSDHKRNFYDEKFHLIPLKNGYNNYEGKVEKPKNWNTLIKISQKLSEDFNYVRVDLYNLSGKIYFGELTFTYAAGLTSFDPSNYNEIWGDYWG